MNWSTLRNTLEAKNETTKEEERAAFRKLVRRVMESPESVDESEIDATLEGCGKSRDDLWNACAVAETRVEYRRQIEESEAAEKRLDSIEQQWTKLHRAVQAAEAKRNAFFDEHREEKLTLEQKIKNAKLAKRRLIETCDDEQVADRLSALAEERKRRLAAKTRLEKRQESAREYLARGQSRLAEAERQGSRDAGEWKKEVARRQEVLREINQQLHAADTHWRSLDREDEAIREEMLYV